MTSNIDAKSRAYDGTKNGRRNGGEDEAHLGRLSRNLEHFDEVSRQPVCDTRHDEEQRAETQREGHVRTVLDEQAYLLAEAHLFELEASRHLSRNRFYFFVVSVRVDARG